jgi:hypothetical protein
VGWWFVEVGLDIAEEDVCEEFDILHGRLTCIRLDVVTLGSLAHDEIS